MSHGGERKMGDDGERRRRFIRGVVSCCMAVRLAHERTQVEWVDGLSTWGRLTPVP